MVYACLSKIRKIKANFEKGGKDFFVKPGLGTPKMLPIPYLSAQVIRTLQPYSTGNPILDSIEDLNIIGQKGI